MVCSLSPGSPFLTSQRLSRAIRFTCQMFQPLPYRFLRRVNDTFHGSEKNNDTGIACIDAYFSGRDVVAALRSKDSQACNFSATENNIAHALLPRLPFKPLEFLSTLDVVAERYSQRGCPLHGRDLHERYPLGCICTCDDAGANGLDDEDMIAGDEAIMTCNPAESFSPIQNSPVATTFSSVSASRSNSSNALSDVSSETREGSTDDEDEDGEGDEDEDSDNDEDEEEDDKVEGGGDEHDEHEHYEEEGDEGGEEKGEDEEEYTTDDDDDDTYVDSAAPTSVISMSISSSQAPRATQRKRKACAAETSTSKRRRVDDVNSDHTTEGNSSFEQITMNDETTGYRCRTCPGFITRASGDMRRHMESLVHKPLKDHICSFRNCGASFTRVDALRRHQKSKQHHAPGVSTNSRNKKTKASNI